jgi:hypothetical protein
MPDLRAFLRGGFKRYQYESDDERLCAAYGAEINSAFHGPALDPDRHDPAKWGGVHRRAVARARARTPQPRQGPRHLDPDQLEIPKELQWKTKS